MSIDDDRMPWPAAEAIERGENPEKPSATFRLATLLAEHDDIHTIHHQMIVAGRVLAFLPRIQAWAASEQAPKGPGQLRQQQVANYDDLDWIEESVHHLRRELAEAEAIYERVKAAYAPQFDPDVRDQDREDARVREARQDERAAENAPTIGQTA